MNRHGETTDHETSSDDVPEGAEQCNREGTLNRPENGPCSDIPPDQEAVEGASNPNAPAETVDTAEGLPKTYDFCADEAEIKRLAALKPIAYDRERDEAAKRLKVRTSTLDAEVEARRKEGKGKEDDGLCTAVEPHPEPVRVSWMLDEVRATISRFIVCDRATATAATLWIAFTWVVDHVQIAPLAVITAPEKRCGKTQFLDVIGRLSRRSLFASNISPAATFRIIQEESPTLIIDEADAFFRQNEELRGIINSGHTRATAYVLRVVGEHFEVKRFSTWGPKAIAGIGRLPETVMDRSIVLPLRRKLTHEKVERLRQAERGLFETLASKLARFSRDYGARVDRSRPLLPEDLHDRAQDNWEPLLAIADLAGPAWSLEARRAARALSSAESMEPSIGEQILLAVRDVFDQDDSEKLTRDELLRRLNADEEQPWATWNKGKPLIAVDLRKLLKPYEIKTKKVRLGSKTARGFERAQFKDAFERYLGNREPSSSNGSRQKWNDGTSSGNQRFGCSESAPSTGDGWNMEHEEGRVEGVVPERTEQWNQDGTRQARKSRKRSTLQYEMPFGEATMEGST